VRGMVASDRQSDPTVDNAQLRRSYARDGDDEEDEDESGRPEQRMKRRNSFNKMQQQMGDESLEAAEVVASQMHGPGRNNSAKTLDQTGTNYAPPKSNSCSCIIC